MKWIISFTAGTITTVAVFAAGIWVLVSRTELSGGELLFHVSVALAPLAMVSVMLGYAVWWMLMFLQTLFFSERKGQDDT